jgi:hypothetical protein
LVRQPTSQRGSRLVDHELWEVVRLPSGGARPRSGPAPDPNALSRDRKSDVGFTVLPASGRVGDPPEWPLIEPSPREAHLWSAFWRKPQAILWELNGQAFEVAMHVRCFAEAEVPNASTAVRTLVRQQADALLLTIPAMHSARVKMSADEVRVKRDAAPTAVPASSSRSRLRQVPDDVASA